MICTKTVFIFTIIRGEAQSMWCTQEASEAGVLAASWRLRASQATKKVRKAITAAAAAAAVTTDILHSQPDYMCPSFLFRLLSLHVSCTLLIRLKMCVS